MTADLQAIRQQLAEHRQIQASLRAEAASLVVRLRAASQRVTSSAVADLNGDLENFHKIEAASPAVLAPWSSNAWQSQSDRASNHPPLYLRSGFTMEKPFASEKPAEIPYMLPLLDTGGALLFLCDAGTADVARNLMINLLLRAAVAAPAQVRFSLIDPLGLGAAFPIRSLLPHVRPSGRTAMDELEVVTEDIRRVNHDVVQMETRFADLSLDKRSAEFFEIVAAVDFPEAYLRDPRATEHILRIANSGPRAGRHLLLELRIDREMPRDLTLKNFTNAHTIDCSKLGFRQDAAPSASLLNQLLANRPASENQAIVGDWNQVVRPAKFFTSDSTEKVETKLGERLPFWLGKDSDGTPCSHAILAGQAGFGKSSLLHVLITGLAARYSPEEIRFLLVDGKRGVEFQAYKTFPHVNVVCLQTSPAVALSVLKDFHAEMTDRFALFGQEDVFDLIEYRSKTRTALPRQIMVVDEYSVLLEADPEEAGKCLLDLLAKGRAAGTHLVLSSQNFDVKLMPAEFGQHIQFRGSLFLPADEVQRMAMFETEGKRLIRELTASGQVVVNHRSGRDGSNARGAVARLEPSNDRRTAVAKLVEEITAAAPAGQQPIVLTGDECAELSANPFVHRWRAQPPDDVTLQATARRGVRDGGFGIPAWSSGDRPLPLWLGRKFDVRGHALAVLRRVPGHNLLSVGSESTFRLSMLANALAGLRSMLLLQNVEVLLLDGLTEGLPGAGLLSAGLEQMEAAGARVLRMTRHDALGLHLEMFLASPSNTTPAGNSRLVIISEPEYFSELHGGGVYGPAPGGAPRTFKELLRSGSQMGTHVIVTASSLSALSNILHPSRDKSLFHHRVVQQMTQEESSVLFDSYVAARVQSQANHVTGTLYIDAVQGNEARQLFKSYCSGPSLKIDQTAVGLRDALSKLYKPKNMAQGS